VGLRTLTTPSRLTTISKERDRARVTMFSGPAPLSDEHTSQLIGAVLEFGIAEAGILENHSGGRGLFTTCIMNSSVRVLWGIGWTVSFDGQLLARL
jgi:hypothetical protein